VYDGYVWTRPDFSVALTPQLGNGVSTGYPIDAGSAIVYTLNIAKAGPASAGWFTPLNFNLSFNFTNGPLPNSSHISLNGTELLPPSYNTTVSGVTQAGWNGIVRIWSTQAVTQVKYLTGIDLITESSLGLAHGASSNYGFGSTVINPDYTLRSNSGKLVIRQSDSSSANLITLGIGNSIPGGGCTNVPVQTSILLGGTPQSWNSFFTSSSSTSVKVKQNTDQSVSLPLAASSTAFIGAGYTLRLTVGPKSCVNNIVHSLDIPLEIKPPAPTATPDKFVIIQGYANFRISRVDANDVWGYAISQMFERYEDLTVGLRPRLVPWYD